MIWCLVHHVYHHYNIRPLVCTMKNDNVPILMCCMMLQRLTTPHPSPIFLLFISPTRLLFIKPGCCNIGLILLGTHQVIDSEAVEDDWSSKCRSVHFQAWAMLKELLSIISQTFSCRMGTISADTNKCVSSRSSITNFFPKIIFSSRWRRNCFTAGSL